MADFMQFSGLFNRCYLPPLPQPQLVYAFFEAWPRAQAVRLPLNFCLVLDRSGSMSGPKIKQLREAVRTMISHLEPDDTISVVAFNAHTEVMIPATAATDPDALTARVGRLEAGGGTSLAPAMRAGLAEIVKHQDPTRASRLIVLTDGQTTGEDDCRAEADRAAAAGVPLMALGLGTDWNEDLLIDLAQRTGELGDTFLIRKPEEVGPMFAQVFNQIKVVAQDVSVRVTPAQGVRVRRAWQVAPQIREVSETAANGPTLAFDLPELTESGAAFLLELLVPLRNPGVYRFVRSEIAYTIPSRAPTRHEARCDLTAEITADVSLTQQVDARVMGVVERVMAHRLQSQALEDVARQDFDSATTRLRAAHTILLEQGEQELARNALAEAMRLERDHELSSEGRKTIKLSSGKSVRLIRPS